MAEPSALAYQVAAQMRLGEGRHDDAIVEAQKAVDLNPNDADSRAVLAEVMIYSGKPEEALPAIAVARRLDPYNEARYAYLEGFARFGLEEFEAAARLLERALELGTDLWPPEAITFREADCDPCELLLAAYGYLGDRDGDIQTLRDRLSGTWNAYMMVFQPSSATDPSRTSATRSGLPKASAAPVCRNIRRGLGRRPCFSLCG